MLPLLLLLIFTLQAGNAATADQTPTNQANVSSNLIIPESGVEPNLEAPEIDGGASEIRGNEAREDASSNPTSETSPTETDSNTGTAEESADQFFERDGVGQAFLSVRTFFLLLIVIVAMGIASGIGFWLRQRQSEKIAAALVDRFNHRLFIWWMMLGILVIGFLLSRIGTVILFGMVSFWALREFITMTNTRRGDHRALFSVFFIFTPLQYILVALGDRTGESWWAIDFYAIFAIMIPVYASVFIPARIAINGDTKRFLERTAKIQAGLLVCVYSLSYAPALLDLNLETSNSVPWTGSRVNLLVFLVVCAQLAGVFERVWSRALGRTVVAQHVNGSRTWEGFLGSVITTGIVGATLAWATPFHWAESIMLAMVIATMAFAGGMTMSAIKRDRGVGDTGSLVQGHAGVLDQIDNVCFAAPVFYHLTRAFFT